MVLIVQKEFIRYFQTLQYKGNPIVYFHNLMYDARLIMCFSKDLFVKNINKNNKIYEMEIRLSAKKWLILKDSLALIPSKLANFPSMFNLTTTGPKEIFSIQLLQSLYIYCWNNSRRWTFRITTME